MRIPFFILLNPSWQQQHQIRLRCMRLRHHKHVGPPSNRKHVNRYSHILSPYIFQCIHAFKIQLIPGHAMRYQQQQKYQLIRFPSHDESCPLFFSDEEKSLYNLLNSESGLASKSCGGPSSFMQPASSTRIWSKSRIVSSLCATAMMVWLANFCRMMRCIRASVLPSTLWKHVRFVLFGKGYSSRLTCWSLRRESRLCSIESWLELSRRVVFDHVSGICLQFWHQDRPSLR